MKNRVYGLIHSSSELHRLIPTNGDTKKMHVLLLCLQDEYFTISAQQHGMMTGRGSKRGSHTEHRELIGQNPALGVDSDSHLRCTVLAQSKLAALLPQQFARQKWRWIFYHFFSLPHTL